LGVFDGFIGFIGGYRKYSIENIKLYKYFLSERMQRFILSKVFLKESQLWGGYESFFLKFHFMFCVVLKCRSGGGEVSGGGTHYM
jgi:hypothetical protein